MNKNAEIQILQIKPGNMKKMIILNCYRPPSGNVDSFVDHIYNALDQVEKLEEFEVYLCGGFNIDYGKPNSAGYRKLNNLEWKYNLNY